MKFSCFAALVLATAVSSAPFEERANAMARGAEQQLGNLPTIKEERADAVARGGQALPILPPKLDKRGNSAPIEERANAVARGGVLQPILPPIEA